MRDLPPPPINAVPEGLLGFLGIKNGGRNPRNLIDNVQPTFDLWMHYLWSNSIVLQSADLSFAANAARGALDLGPTLPVNVANAANQVIVPNNEWWAFLEWNIGWTLPAAIANGTFDAELIAYEENRGMSLGGTSQYLAGVTTANAPPVAMGGARYWRGIRLVRPNSLLQLFHFGTTGGTGPAPVTAVARWRITRLPV